MENYYSFFGLSRDASPQDIKRAFRERAKRLHPDLVAASRSGARGGAGAFSPDAADTGAAMRKLLAAYEVLSNPDRRMEYDRALARFVNSGSFDYRAFLMEEPDNPERNAKLVLFDLLHLEEDESLAVWRRFGGLGFPLEKYLDREDWMDCVFILAEELEKRQHCFEAFVLFTRIIRAERQRPYFRHFIEDIESALKDLVRNRLRRQVDDETWISCMETLLDLDFPPKDEARWLRSMAEALVRLGELREAEAVLREALRRDPALPNVLTLRRKLNVR